MGFRQRGHAQPSGAAGVGSLRRVVISIVIGVAVCVAGVGLAVAVNPEHASGRTERVVRDTPSSAIVVRRQRPASTSSSTSSSSTTSSTTMTTQPEGVLPAAPPATPVAVPNARLAPAYSVVPTTNRVVFLGIDDGIVRDPAVLAWFQQAHIPFTVFLVKPMAQADLPFWRAIQAAGGTIESHTISHPDLRKLPSWKQRQEICGTLDSFQLWFGRRPTLFRPPYGYYDANVRANVASCGYKAMVLWRGSTNDGRLDLQDRPMLRPGDILLMHWRTDLLADLQVVVDRCREQGFTIARLEDYLSPGT